MNSALYDVFAAKAEMIENSVSDDLPAHKFSMRYKRRKKALIKAYEQKKEHGTDIQVTFRKIRVRQAIRFAVIAVLAAAMLTGAGLYVTHYIGGLQANQQSTHTDAFALDWENAPLTLEKTYRLTYDLSDWDKTIMSDYDFSYWEVYRRNDEYLNYIYQTKEYYQNVRLNTEGTHIEKRVVCGYDALYFEHSDGSKCLAWDDGDYIFELQFNFDYDTAIQIAESIKEVG